MPKPKTTPGPEGCTVSGRRSVVMRSLATALVVFLSSSSSTMAGDLENGIAAYNRLDSVTAWRLLQPLAERLAPPSHGLRAVISDAETSGVHFSQQGLRAGIAPKVSPCSAALRNHLAASEWSCSTPSPQK